MIALLSNINVASLASRLANASSLEVFTAKGYNTWLQELTTPNSEFIAASPETAFLLFDGRELLRESEDAETILPPLAEAIAKAAQALPAINFVVSSLDIPQERIKPLISHRGEVAAASLWRREIEALHLPILELSEIASEMGRERFYNRRVWYMGALPFSQAGESALVAEMVRIQRAIRGERCKCLALDLDNTLWGGVIGEVGTGGVELEPAGPGARYYDMQRRIKELKEQGVLLALLTKNNEEDALAGIDEHPSMLLRRDDFAAIRANWQPKAENLLSIAKELNISTDSFVFVDDNGLEREMMRIALPEVFVPEFPGDPSRLEDFIRALARDRFLAVRTTDEDREKTSQYRAGAGREAARTSFESVQDYLRSLDMVLTFELLNESNLPRAAALTQKTNQFNLTTKRLSEADMRAAMQDPTRIICLGALRDRFGDLGRVILASALISEDRAVIDLFLMSCRVMGRGVEAVFLQAFEALLAERGVKMIEASYLPSAKNSVVRNFWDEQGYERLKGGEHGIIYTTFPRTTIAGDVIIHMVRLYE